VNKLNYIMIILFVLYTIWFVVIHRQDLRKSQPLPTAQKTPTEVVMFCQELAAKATNKGWNYKSCLEEVGKTLRSAPMKTI
jgi:hypothetical protein